LLGTKCICIQKTWKNHLFLSILSFLGTKWLKKGHFWCYKYPETSRYYSEKPTIDGKNEVRLVSLSILSLLLWDTYKKKKKKKKKKNVNHRSSNILGTLYRSTRWPHMLKGFFRVGQRVTFLNHIFRIVFVLTYHFTCGFLCYPLPILRYFNFEGQISRKKTSKNGLFSEKKGKFRVIFSYFAIKVVSFV